MTISTFDRLRRPISAGLLPLVAALALQPLAPEWASARGNGPASAGSNGPASAGGDYPGAPGRPATDEEVKSTNVRWHVKEDVVIVNYDLPGDPAVVYRVEIIMKREGDETFSATPQTVEGHVGEGYWAGANREIRWYFRRDYPQGFQGEGYYFECRVETVGADNTILYYALGAAALAGGIIAVIVGGSQEEPAALGLPAPPARP